MNQLTKYLYSLVLSILLPLTCTFPCYAASIYDWEIGPSTGEREYKNVTLSNVITLTVTVSDDTDEVIVNGEQARWSSIKYEDCSIDIYLKPGQNDIVIEAVDEDDPEDNDEETLTINYVQANIPGSQYIFRDLSSARSEMDPFTGAIKLEVPEQLLVMSGGKPASNQNVIFRITRPMFKPAANVSYASNIFSIKGASNAYDLGPNCTLTIRYDEHISDTEADMLTVMRVHPAFSAEAGMIPGLAQNIGGRVDKQDKTISVTLPDNTFGHYAVVKMTGDFSDFYEQDNQPSPVSWSRPYVLTLWAKGIMSPLENYPDGKKVPGGYFGLVKPSSMETVPITRLELVCMLVKALKLPRQPLATISPTFEDLDNLSYEEKIDIETAASYGLISGFPGAEKLKFRPQSPVTRQQAAIVFARAAKAELPDARQAAAVVSQYFEDHEQIENWAAPYVLSSLQMNILSMDEPGWFKPQEPLTRAEAARSVYLIMKNNNFL